MQLPYFDIERLPDPLSRAEPDTRQKHAANEPRPSPRVTAKVDREQPGTGRTRPE
ncbi:hypothetical protein [Pseudomonas sp. PIC25]|uniref:hypothetical protein n=1 Tax=Pseudomonas sp. PIC25 TaxID=1958773 RepID=UPI00143DA824|nr:hypothetical protein [Pseudomonas sp. PIC25]